MASSTEAPRVELEIPEKLLPLLSPKQFKVLYGGRGSTKSHTVAQLFVMLSMQAKHRILCVREIQKSIAQSSKRVIEDYIHRKGLSAYFKINKQGEDQIVCTLTGSTFSFAGLQDHTADSIKSYEGTTLVWAEEASNISTTSWNKLIPTIVRTTGAEIWVTFNPDDEADYAYARWVKGHDPDATVIQINYDGNPWWNDAMEAERLKMLALSQDLHDHVFGGKCRSKAGILFKRSWVKHYDKLPDRLNYYIASDYAGEPDPDRPESEPDFTEHGVWGVDSELNLYAVDWWYGQTSPEEWIAQWMRLVKVHSPLVAFEEKGVILRSLSGVINQRMQTDRKFVVREGLAPAGSKLERAYGFAAMMQAGKVRFPNPDKAPWVNRLIEQLCAFHGQGGQFDDGVDVCTLMARGLDEVVRARPPDPPPPPPPTPFTEDWFAARDRSDAKDAARKKSYYR